MRSQLSDPAEEIERVRRRVVADLAEARRASTGRVPPHRRAIARARHSLAQAWVLAGLHRGDE